MADLLTPNAFAISVFDLPDVRSRRRRSVRRFVHSIRVWPLPRSQHISVGIQEGLVAVITGMLQDGPVLVRSHVFDVRFLHRVRADITEANHGISR